MSEQDAQAAILGCLAWRVEQKREQQRASRRAYYQRRKEQEERYDLYGLVMLMAIGYVWGKKIEPFLDALAPKPKPKTASAEAFDRLWRE